MNFNANNGVIVKLSSICVNISKSCFDKINGHYIRKAFNVVILANKSRKVYHFHFIRAPIYANSCCP